MSAASTAGIRAGRAYVEIGAREKLNAGLSKAHAKLQQWGKAVAMMGRQFITAGVTAAVPFALATRTFTQFDDAMRATKAVTQSTEAEFRMLTETAKRLGRTTSFTAVEVANIMTELGRAGFAAREIDVMTLAVLDLSRATQTDPTNSAGFMAASLRQFGLGAEHAQRVADGFTYTANKTFNTVEALGEALKYAGPVAAEAGMTFEDTLAVMGTLGNVGIQGSMAGTSMRRLLTLTGAHADAMREIFGVDPLDAAGNIRPLVDVMDDLANATKGMASGTRVKAFEEFFGLLGITSASVISKSVAATRELRNGLQQAGGVSRKTAQEMDAGIGGMFRILLSAVEGVAISFGEALAPALIGIGEKLTAAAGWLSKLIDRNQWLAKALALAVAGLIGFGVYLLSRALMLKALAMAIGPVILALKGLSLAVTIATAVLKAFTSAAVLMKVAAIALAPVLLTLKAIGLAFSLIVSPVLLLTAALGALAAYTIYSTGVGVKAFHWLGDTGGKAIAWLSARFSDLKDDVMKSMRGIMDAMAVGDIGLAAEILWATIKIAWQHGVNAVKEVWASFTAWILTHASTAWHSLLAGLEVVWHGIKIGVIEAAAFFSKTWANAVGFVRKAFANTVGAIKTMWNSLSSTVEKGYHNAQALTNPMAAATLQFEHDRINNRQQTDQREINAEINKAHADANADMQAAHAEANNTRAQRLADEAKRHDAELADLNARHARIVEGLRSGDAEERAANAQKLAELQAKRDALTAKAAEKRAEAARAAARAPTMPDLPTAPAPATIQAGLANAMRSQLAGSRGTFSAFAIQGLLGNNAGAAERTAKNTEKTAKMLEKIARDGGVAFGM